MSRGSAILVRSTKGYRARDGAERERCPAPAERERHARGRVPDSDTRDTVAAWRFRLGLRRGADLYCRVSDLSLS